MVGPTPVLNGKAAKIVREASETGEPVFVLRSKDLLSVLGVLSYLELVERFVSDPEMQESIHNQLEAMKEWQRDHAGEVRLPD